MDTTPARAGAQHDSRLRDPAALFDAARRGDRVATGRLLSLVERGGPVAREVGRITFPSGSDPGHVVGITGAPGAGKSTITDRLITLAREGGAKVGVLAVDPSSPFSGGAILGDRIRMQSHALDEGVFIRSMASRGHQGGLALAAPEAIRVLSAIGMQTVIVETVGVGQVEVEIAGEADTTLVVVNPGWGDAVQASKAGLLEVADVFVVNKADRPGAAETRRDLENMLDMNTVMGEWRPPVILTAASSAGEDSEQGLRTLWSAVLDHKRFLDESGELLRRRERRLLAELERVIRSNLSIRVHDLAYAGRAEPVREALLRRQVDPYEAAEQLMGLAGL
ncbi:MAG TPA: methylmalonyl Co-A mutase-associated GTPase MeaB [Acidimicrobiales bacterium]|nr:methylmalonyl Co-A mutase-associated GTPase MeaB [Acidimicrobiales bacterium]